MARVGVIRDGQGKIETLLSVRAAKEQGVKEFKDDQDAECQAFSNPPPRPDDEIIDARPTSDAFVSGLLGMLAERLPGSPTVDELLADIKRLK